MKVIDNLSMLDLDATYSYADYLTWQFGQTVELIKGKIFPMSVPGTKHQKVSWELSFIVANHFRNHSCYAFAAPFDVRLIDKAKSAKANKEVFTVIQPDLCIRHFVNLNCLIINVLWHFPFDSKVVKPCTNAHNAVSEIIFIGSTLIFNNSVTFYASYKMLYPNSYS